MAESELKLLENELIPGLSSDEILASDWSNSADEVDDGKTMVEGLLADGVELGKWIGRWRGSRLVDWQMELDKISIGRWS